MPGRKIFLRPHLGLGDHLICAGLVRKLAEEALSLVLPVKEFYTVSISQLFSDLPKVKILPIDPRAENQEVAFWWERYEAEGYELLALGSFGKDFMAKGAGFDESFYIQAGLDPQLRWSNFSYVRRPEMEQQFKTHVLRAHKIEPGEPYSFLHDDPQRALRINPERIPRDVTFIRPLPEWTSNVLFYRALIEGAESLHLIDSSFAILADFFDLSGVTMKVIHRYVRPEQKTLTTHYKQDWMIIP